MLSKIFAVKVGNCMKYCAKMQNSALRKLGCVVSSKIGGEMKVKCLLCPVEWSRRSISHW